MKISILTPVGYNHSPYYWLSLIKSIEYFKNKDITLHLVTNRIANIYFAREELIQNVAEDSEYILWVDSDCVFNPEQIEQLIAHNKDIICGMAKYQDLKSNCVKWNFGKYIPQAYDSLGVWLRNGIVGEEELGTEPFEVDYTGCHFMLMKKEIKDKLKFPIFEPLPVSLIHQNIKGYMSEDGALCWKLKEAGYKIYIDPKCKTGHDKGIVLK